MLEAALPTLAALQAPVLDRLAVMEAELHGMITADFGAINEVSEYLFARRGSISDRRCFSCPARLAEDRARKRSGSRRSSS